MRIYIPSGILTGQLRFLGVERRAKCHDRASGRRVSLRMFIPSIFISGTAAEQLD